MMNKVALADQLDRLLGMLYLLQSVRFNELCDHGVNGVHIVIDSAISVAEQTRNYLSD